MTRPELTACAIALAIGCVAIGCGGEKKAPQIAPGAVSPDALPSEARAALTAKWKGWTVATAPASSCATSAKASGQVVTSDFDSDGLPDFALEVQTPDGVRLVILLGRNEDYKLFDVDAAGTPAAGLSLGIEPQGRKYISGDPKIEQYYSADTVTTYACPGTRTSYVWSGLNFYKVDASSQ